ncbi:MAG: oxygenase MpaB family protein [Nitriliruptoraceae bacterium]
MRRNTIPDRPFVGASLLAGGASVVMQLARPEVGHAVVESRVVAGQLFRRPLRRTRTTLSFLAVAIAGSDDQRRTLGAEIDAVHRRVRSSRTSPLTYDASDPQLQLWVAACLYRGIEDTHEAFFGPLTEQQRESLYAWSAPLATTLQVTPEQWPPDRNAFETFWAEGLRHIRIDAVVHTYLDDVVALRFLPRWLAAPLARPHRFVTAGFLPAPFRDAMGFAWSARQQRRFDRWMAVAGAAVRRLPRPVREFPFDVLLADVRRRIRHGRGVLR